MALMQIEGDLSPAPQNPFHVPLGAASPLWLMFAGAASVGVAYWWMTRWTAATHLEAAFGEATLPTATPALEPEPTIEKAATLAEPMEALEELVEVALEPAATEVEPAVAPETPKPKVKSRPDTPPTA